MGRYVPPDLEGKVSFNQASGKGHSLGARARKLKTEGALVVRFECPFAIWCTNCQPEQIIGQGVRFNAEKKKVGSYFSSPIWSFKFKHTVCGGFIEVRTDPKNTEYVVVEGGRRRDTGADKVLDGEIRIGSTDEEKEKLEKEGGFGTMEKQVEDKRVVNTQQARINELVERSEKDWSDPYQMNKRIRRDFRVGRRQRQADAKTGQALQDKFGLGLDLLIPQTEDAERARYIEFDAVEANSVSTLPMFKPTSSTRNLKSHGEQKNGKVDNMASKTALQKTLRGNTRTVVDPFLRESEPWQPRVKRKKVDEMEESLVAATNEKSALVGYGSDSE